MTTKIKSAESLEELELNKLLKYLSQNEHWVYYLIVRLGVSTALRFSDLSRIKWIEVLEKLIALVSEGKEFLPIHGARRLVAKYGKGTTKVKHHLLNYHISSTILQLPSLGFTLILQKKKYKICIQFKIFSCIETLR